MSLYDITYKNLGRTQPLIFTALEMGEYRTQKKRIKLECNFPLNLSSIHPEISLDTHKLFLTEK